MNVTATQGTASGYVTIYPSGTAAPSTSNLNFGPGESAAGLAIVQAGADGKVAFKNGSSGTTHLIADVSGYFTAPDASPDQPSSFSIFPCDTSCSAEPWGTSSLLPDLQAKVTDPDSPTLTAVFTVQDAAGAAVATGSDVVNSGDIATYSFPADQPLSPGKTYKFTVTAKDATSSTVSGWHTFTTAADASTAALALAEPLTLHGTGAALRWTPYRNTGDDPDLTLAEYQVFRGPTTVASYTPGNTSLKLAGTVPADQTTFTDTTAAPAAAYRYWVVARTDADVKLNRDAQAGPGVNSNSRDVTLPATGQTTQILIGTTPAKAGDPITDVRDATISSKTPTTSSPSLRPGTGIARRCPRWCEGVQEPHRQVRPER